MKVQVITLFAAFLGFLTVFADPVKVGSKGELAEAKAAVKELVGTGISAQELVKAAEDCENGSERYYLYLAAFRLQAQAEEYDRAAETLKNIRADIVGAPLAEVVATIEKSLGKKLKNASAIQPLYRSYLAMAQAERQITRIKKELKGKPKNAALLRVQLGEAQAVTGDWEGALESFAKGTGEVAEIAKDERSAPSATIASFWWDYEPRMKGTEAFFKAHAASIYQGLLDQDALSGIQKLTAEKRIAAAEELGTVVEEPEHQSVSNKPKVKNMPFGFKKVSYVESTGSQGVDIDVKASTDLCMELDFTPLEYTGNVTVGVAGDDLADWRFFNHAGGMIFDVGSTRVGWSSDARLANGTRYLLSFGVINDQVYLEARQYESKNMVGKRFTNAFSGTVREDPVCLFGGYIWGPYRFAGNRYKLYSLKVTKGGVLIRDLVPCIDKGGKPGLWDSVGGVFYTNKAGDNLKAAETIKK